MRAWLFQDHRQLQKLGANCPWSVGWYDPDGKRCSKCVGAKSLAEKFSRRIEGQLAAGTYEVKGTRTWSAFRADYEAKILPNLSAGSQGVVTQALDAFQAAVKPHKLASIKTSTLDAFIAKRRSGRGRRVGSVTSVATINKELRTLKAVLRIAHDWGDLQVVPKFRMLKEPEKLPRFVTADDFGKILDGCEVATYPKKMPFAPSLWWSSLLTFAYMTGWRIGECLALSRADIDLDAGTIITRAKVNKGKRDELVPLHPIVVGQLRELKHSEPLAFPWYQSRRTLYDEFHRIQTAGGIHTPCPLGDDGHEHSATCHLYGFHTFRSAFATMNADLPANTLQKLMRHVSFTTTQRYISMANHVKAAVGGLYVPPALSK